MSNKSPQADDITVGSNIRRIRTMRRMSQEALGEKLGVTFQQVQKYEKGMNRVSAGRLAQLAEALDVGMMDLLEGLAKTGSEQPPMMSVTAMKLAASFDRITDEPARRSILQVVRIFAEES